MLKKKFFSKIATALVAFTLGTHAFQYEDGIAAIVGDEVITVYDIQTETHPIEKELYGRYKGAELKDKVMEVRKKVLRKLVEDELVYLDFRKLGASVPEAAIQSRLDKIIMKRTNGDRDKFEKMLLESNQTFKDIEDKIEKHMAIELLLRERVNQLAEVTPEEVEKRYKENQAKAKAETEVKLQIILLNPSSTVSADKVMSELKNGSTFSDVAKKWSKHATAASGGSTPWLKLNELAAPLKDAIKKMGKGEIAKPVVLEKDTYIIKLLDMSAQGSQELTSQLKVQLENEIYKEKIDKLHDEYIEELKTKHYVRMY